jgi:glycosyltransferase involved in cell wall biosynthesis
VRPRGSRSGPPLAILVKRFPRLSETFIVDELLELRRRGLDFVLYALAHPGEPAIQPRARELCADVVYIALPGAVLRRQLRLWSGAALWSMQHPQHAVQALRARSPGMTTRASLYRGIEALWLARDLRRRGVRHVHVHFMHSPAALTLRARLAGGPPYSVTGHAKDVFTTPLGQLRSQLERARFTTTCTQAAAEHLRSVLGPVAGRIHVLRHGVDIERFTPDGRSPRAGRILCVARLVSKKGHTDLIAALALLGPRVPAAHLQLIGGGPCLADLLTAARFLGVGAAVDVLGACTHDRVLWAYRQADVVVLASTDQPDGDRDGIPNVLAEAMAVGVPVVATRAGAIEELITDGVSGLLVTPGRPEELADALERVLVDRRLNRRLGEAGRAAVTARFDLRACVAPLVALLADATVRSGPRDAAV